jgi:hypothetical protein
MELKYRWSSAGELEATPPARNPPVLGPEAALVVDPMYESKCDTLIT